MRTRLDDGSPGAGQRASQLKSKSESPLTRKKSSSSRSAASASAPAVPAGLALDHRLDAHAANGASLVDGREIAGPISAQQQGALDAVAAGFIQQVVEERPAADVEHRLGRSLVSPRNRLPRPPTRKTACSTFMSTAAPSAACPNAPGKVSFPRAADRPIPSFPAATSCGNGCRAPIARRA